MNCIVTLFKELGVEEEGVTGKGQGERKLEQGNVFLKLERN